MRDESLLGDSPLEHAQGLAELAFGSFTQTAGLTQARHLALLPAESLELDLNDPAQRQFGDYELLELVGEGGMGVVYRARQLSLDREVAVKLLSAGPWASKEFIARFEREAQNAARMQHPAIVTVYEVGSFEGMQFFSMRLVRGESLSARLKRGEKSTPREAAALIRTVAEAVGYAHSLGVLHLDLKPSNVLLDEAGQPYVADFGLARRLENALAVDNDEVSGTPAYMAPEQAQVRAHKLTATTDIWGLGAILYELLTGRPPFRADTAQDTVKLVLQGQVRAPRRFRPTLPLDLEAIVMRCLSRNPTERYPSARALADDLARFAEGRPVQARPLNGMQRVARWTRREPRLAASIACALFALVVGLVATTYQWRHARKNAVLAQNNADLAQRTLWKSRSDVAQRQMQQDDAYPALANVLANLRDMEAHGDRDDAALERLRIGTVLANAPQLIDAIPLGDKQITALAISPDGQFVAAVTGLRTIHLIDVASGRQRWQVEATPDSFGMTAFDLNQGFLELHFSDDGRRLIGHDTTGGPAAGENPMLYPHEVDGVMIDVATGKLVAPPKRFADFLAVDYSEDGRYALLFDRRGDVQRWRTLPWAPDGDLVRIEDAITPSHNGQQSQQLQGEALLTDDGATMVLADASKLRLRSFDARHMRLRQTLTLTTEQDRATAWALRHDDKQLAIGTTSGQIVAWGPVTGRTTWLHARLSGWISRLSFSADDSRLLAVSSEPSEMRVFDARDLEPVATPVVLGNNLNPGVITDADFGPDAATVLTYQWATGAIVWRVPERGWPLQAPVPAVPSMVAEYARFALAHDPRSHLMATADNGLLKLWRVRWAPFVGGTAAPMVQDTLRFDGRHLVSADGNRVYVFDVANGQPVGKTIALPEAPTFAGLDGSGSRLIAFSGREVSCWNWRNGKPCWPAITLPDSPLRLGLAAAAPIMAVATGSNEKGKFFEHVRLVDLATGQQRGAPIDLRGPLGALRLSDDGRRLLVFEHRNTISTDSDVLRVIDTASARIVQNLLHKDKPRAQLIDARFSGDGGIWSLSGPTEWGAGPDAQIWHWDADGKLPRKIANDDGDFSLLALPRGRGVIQIGSATVYERAGAVTRTLTVPDPRNRVNAGALSPDGTLLALATLDGVDLFVVDRNQRLVPDFKLALPNHDVVQQLAFAPDGSRLIGRTMSGHWFQWRTVADTRPVADIERDLRLRDFTALSTDDAKAAQGAPKLTDAQRRRLRAADPGPAPEQAPAPASNANVAAPTPDARYEPLDIDAIANVEPRAPMNRNARVPPHPQSWPTLPRGLQRYDGVDFLLGRAVQLSGTLENFLNTEFPARSPPLRITPQRVAAIDALVFQFQHIAGEVGVVRLRYADGGERVLAIDSRDVLSSFDIAALENPVKARIGWLGNYATAMHWWGMGDGGEETDMNTTVVRLANPEPDRVVAAISLEAPPTASPGLLFLALTLEPSRIDPRQPFGNVAPLPTVVGTDGKDRSKSIRGATNARFAWFQRGTR
ncbi:MAG TPA: serine/threonine-protein kinase [Rhodanobacteraceae bacterium]|nr:serine/threonine-protein kinase [Rhodanobacteraceae bacterium]